jgi:hypothetical protein
LLLVRSGGIRGRSLEECQRVRARSRGKMERGIGAALKMGGKTGKGSTVSATAVFIRGSSEMVGWRAMEGWSMPMEMSSRGTFWVG